MILILQILLYLVLKTLLIYIIKKYIYKRRCRKWCDIKLQQISRRQIISHAAHM